MLQADDASGVTDHLAPPTSRLPGPGAAARGRGPGQCGGSGRPTPRSGPSDSAGQVVFGRSLRGDPHRGGRGVAMPAIEHVSKWAARGLHGRRRSGRVGAPPLRFPARHRAPTQECDRRLPHDHHVEPGRAGAESRPLTDSAVLAPHRNSAVKAAPHPSAAASARCALRRGRFTGGGEGLPVQVSRGRHQLHHRERAPRGRGECLALPRELLGGGLHDRHPGDHYRLGRTGRER